MDWEQLQGCKLLAWCGGEQQFSNVVGQLKHVLGTWPVTTNLLPSCEAVNVQYGTRRKKI